MPWYCFVISAFVGVIFGFLTVLIRSVISKLFKR